MKEVCLQYLCVEILLCTDRSADITLKKKSNV
jgi:hypothetical protein